MSTAQQHIIQKIQLELQCSEQRAGQELQFQYQETLQKEVLPGLEELLNTYCPADELIIIDKLNIDLGNLQPGLKGKNLAEKMLAAIEKALQGNLQKVERKETVQRIPIAQVRLEQLMHYLSKGYWPVTVQNLKLEEVIKVVLEKETTSFFQALKKANQITSVKIFERLVLQLEEATLEVVLQKALSWAPVKFLEEVKTLFLQTITPQQVKKRKLIWQGILEQVFSNQEEKKSVGLSLTPVLRAVVQSEPALVLAFQKLAVEIPSLKLAKEIAALKLQEIAVPKRASKKSTQEKSTSESSARKKEQKTTEEIKQQDKIKVGEKLLAKQKRVVEAESFDYILGENVGVLLLHPFLRSFFDESQLLDVLGNFKNDAAAEKAVGLLHFLATGQREAEEHQLVFQKLFCALPLNHPIAKEFTISAAEEAESEKMMTAAIQYWDALGKTSIAGLREGFLQREGHLKQDEQGLQIKLEYTTMDILLEKIPWNISMIQLPWQKGLLNVNWRKQ